jgi:hypothetical protein
MTKIDAGKIADCLRCDFLPECHMVSTEIRDRRRILRYRHLLVLFGKGPSSRKRAESRGVGCAKSFSRRAYVAQ